MSRNIIFKAIKVTPEDLLLDPNNPRLVRDLNSVKHIEDKDILKVQSDLEDRYSESGLAGDEFTDIRDLYDSMMRVGYVGIDRIVVREIEALNKYLVLEGNRRTSAIKRLLKNAESFKGADLRKFDAIRQSFDEIQVLLLKTKGLSEEEVEERVSVILGLRHFGSVLDWEPINRAFNAYQNYMTIDPPLKEFAFENERCKEVASQLSISSTKVKSALKTYITYRQLTEINMSVEEEHYSLITAAIPLSKYGYFDQDPSSYKLSEDSLSKLESLCQFSERQAYKGTDRLIISEPKKFNRLGKLLKQAKEHENEAIRQRARDLIQLVEAGELDSDGNLEMSVDLANSLLTTEINRKEWVQEIGKLLDKRHDELPFEKYDGEGNHLKAKENLEAAIVHLRKIFGV